MKAQFRNLRDNALTIAVLATVVAVLSAAGGVAASKLITGKQIKNGTVTTKDIKNRTIKAADLSKGLSVTGATGATGPAGPAGQASGAGPIASADDDTLVSTTSDTFSSVPGMSISYTMPTDATKLIVTFSANCSVSPAALGKVRLLVDGSPITPDDSAMCSGDWGSNTMQRVVSAGAGAHTVTAEYASNGVSALKLDDKTLLVQAAS